MKHQDKASWYQCAFRRLAFSTGSGSCQSTHFNQLNVRIEWMWEANGSWVFRWTRNLDTFLSWIFSNHWSFPRLHHEKLTFHGLISGIAGGSQDHLPLAQWIPIQSTQKGFQRKRLHVNASKFNSLNNVLKPKKKCFRTFLSTSNLVKIQLPTLPGNQRTKPASSVPSSTSPGIRLSKALKKLVEGWSLQWIIVIDVVPYINWVTITVTINLLMLIIHLQW